MTGNLLLDLAISLAGIIVLVGLAQLIFKDRTLRLTRALAEERLTFDEPDFSPVGWLIDEEAGAALAKNNAGETALLTVLGDKIVTRRYAPREMQGEIKSGSMTVRRRDPFSKPVSLRILQSELSEWRGLLDLGPR